MKKDIDEILKEKCRQVNIDYDFKVKSKSGKKVMYKLVASFSALGIIVFGAYYFNIKSLESGDFATNNGNIVNIDVPQFEPHRGGAEAIQQNVSKGTYLSAAASLKADNIVIAKIDGILGYKSYVKEQDSYPYLVTCIRATTVNSLRGNLTGTFDFYNLGGTIPIEDYEKLVPYDKFQKLKEELKIQEYEENTHISLTFPSGVNMPKIDVGHTYVLLLRYDDAVYDMYTTNGFIQGIFEYDEKTNKIKSNITNEWGEIDLTKF